MKLEKCRIVLVLRALWWHHFLSYNTVQHRLKRASYRNKMSHRWFHSNASPFDNLAIKLNERNIFWYIHVTIYLFALTKDMVKSRRLKYAIKIRQHSFIYATIWAKKYTQHRVKQNDFVILLRNHFSHFWKQHIL